jgi:UDP-N-acetylmuramate dehydrogenase
MSAPRAVVKSNLDLSRLADALAAALGPEAVERGRLLARHTAFRIGGPADLTVTASSTEMLAQAVALCQSLEAPFRVLGGGSNILISDAGIRGIVILNRAKGITFPPAGKGQPVVVTESGASLSTCAQQCVSRGLAGLEWATGIPGTVGGAVVGNAGAWGSDTASSLLQAGILQAGGARQQISALELGYDYRTSLLKTGALGIGTVVLDATFGLATGERETLQANVAGIHARRKASQPSGATCGSVFRNPPGDFAGRLIEAVGLKGQHQGDAAISTVHANFIVNEGQATAGDVKNLIDLARSRVMGQFGIEMALEIELLGEW